jgi:hypothetical protein
LFYKEIAATRLLVRVVTAFLQRNRRYAALDSWFLVLGSWLLTLKKTNKMKHLIKLSLIVAVTAFTLTSCEKDPAAPVISDVEIGMDNSKTAYVGGDLHIDASILADAKIARIVLTIHPEGEGAHAPAQKIVAVIQSDNHWEVDSTYTGKYAGVKNIQFHEDLEIPDNIEAGAYHFELLVVDMLGQTTEHDEEITLLAKP